MTHMASVLIEQRDRLREIAEILARYGLAEYAQHAAHAHPRGNRHSAHLLTAQVDPALAGLALGWTSST